VRGGRRFRRADARCRRLAGSALLAAVVLLNTGFSWAIIGDSVTYDAREEIARLDGFVRAYGGVDMMQGRPAVVQFERRGYERVVIALGLNDVSYHATPTELRQRIRQIMSRDAQGIECVLWVDLKTTSNTHAAWPSRSGRFNSILNELAPQYGVRVLRWSLMAAQHPAWFRHDGLHLTAAGQNGYARWLDNRVDHFCP
jgi:hypothetical protein